MSGRGMLPTTLPDPLPEPPVLSVRGLCKRYRGGAAVLDGVDLEVRRGEFVSLVGASGCGKSTLLRLLAGLGRPTSGRIEWPGRDVGRGPDAAPELAPDLALVPQEPTLLPWRRVFDNVHLPLRLAGQGRRAAGPQVMAALAAVGLAEVAAAFPRQLSGGMKMRVSIARALVCAPRVLLLDEPFAALDEVTRNRLNDDLLVLWRQRGLTVILVTHSVPEAVHLSTRILVLRGAAGLHEVTIPAQGPARELAHGPDLGGARVRGSRAAALAIVRVSRALREAGAAPGPVP